MKKISMVFLLLLSLMLAACAPMNSKPRHYTTNEGKLSKSDTKLITLDYKINSTEGFYASIDFDITDGKVEWEITNPKGEMAFSGYVANENGKTYRELRYPQNQLNSSMNNKEEVNDVSDFNYLQFEVGSLAGIYQLKLKPLNSVGIYKVKWSDKLPRK
jgi:hypothetical protein